MGRFVPNASWVVVVAAALTTFSPAARAQDSFLSEIKGGIMAHDAPLLASEKEGGVDVNLEALFLSPDFLSFLASPRPHVGTHINTSGDTNQLYAGLTWTWYPFQNPLWGAFSFGGSVHDGKLHATERDRKALGSRVLFRLGAEIGYDVTEDWRISLLWDHVSNADLADENESINNVGVRLGFRF